MDSLERGRAISQSGRVPTWFILSLCAVALFICAGVLSERMHIEGRFEVPLDRVRVESDVEGAYIPGAWEEFIAAKLLEVGRVDSDDPRSAERVAERLASLPMIHSVESAHVVIPDGLELDVRLRRIVACVKSAEGFLPVSEDGVILPGFSVAPISDGVGHAPLIAWDESARALQVGDELSEEQHFDALSVALSMQLHLSAEVRASLGPVRVDASGAALASVTEPGVVIYLTERRAALFGRAPLHGHAGELPEETKWAHLSRYLVEPPQGAEPWEILDIRWDEPDVLQRR